MNKIITTVACLTISALLHAQNPIFVTPNGTGDGTSLANACSLENAVKTAVSNDQIWVQSGTHYPTKMLVVPASVKIYGGFAGTETLLSQRLVAANPTIIDGQNKIGSIFRLESAAELHGLTIQNGNANGNLQKSGGGVWADKNCVIAGCIITNNAAILNGGGIYAKGKVKIISCIVENNTANGSGSDLFGNCVVLGVEQSGMSLGVEIVGCNGGIPDFGEVSFKSEKTWKVTDNTNGTQQEWSDVVMASNCDKTIYYGGVGGNYYSDCRNNSTYGHLFSWCAVARFAHILCPVPWRVPTRDDFINLDKTLGGTGAAGQSNTTLRNKYINSWGGTYGGYSTPDGSRGGQSSAAYYWSQTGSNSLNGYGLTLYSGGGIYPQGNYNKKSNGLSLRCVK